MKIIHTPRSFDYKQNGSLIIESSTSRATGDPETVINDPLKWLKASVVSGSLLRIGDGVSHQSGDTPVMESVNFGSLLRVCLIEVATPVTSLSSVAGSGYTKQLLSIDSISYESIISTSPPSPYTSVNAVLRYPSDSTPEIRITVLGIVSGGRLALGERILFKGSVDGVLYPDYYVVSRYPHLIQPASPEGVGYYTDPGDNEYFYTEADMIEAET